MAVEASRSTSYRNAIRRGQRVSKRPAAAKTTTTMTTRSVFGEISNLPEGVAIKAAEQTTATKKPTQTRAKGAGEKTQWREKVTKVYANTKPVPAAGRGPKNVKKRREAAVVKPEPVVESAAEETTATTTHTETEVTAEQEACATTTTADDTATATAEVAQEETTEKTTDIYKCPHETPEIMSYLAELETRYRLRSDYMTQGDIKPHMRSVLVDWMIRVQEHYKMSQLTLQQSVTFLDMVLSRRAVKTSHLQLVGITCIYVAAKYTERFPPEVKELCRLTEDSYRADQLLRMERVVLNTLKFELFAPEPSTFLDHMLQVSSTDTVEDKKVAYGARYFLDLMLTELDLVRLLPSMRAAISLNLAREMVLGESQGWTTDLILCNGYTESCLEKMVNRLNVMLESTHKGSRFQAAYDKYERSKYARISQAFKYA